MSTKGYTAECPEPGCRFETVPVPTLDAVAEQFVNHGVADHQFSPRDIVFAVPAGPQFFPRVN